MIDHIDHPANTTIDEIYVYNQQSWGGGGTTGTSPFGKTPEERFGRACKIGDGIMEEYKGTLISAVDYFCPRRLLFIAICTEYWLRGLQRSHFKWIHL